MTAVANFLKMGAYSAQVSAGDLYKVPLTGKNSSDGLRTTWEIQLMPSHRISRTSAAMMNLAGRGAGRHQRLTRRHTLTVRRAILFKRPARRPARRGGLMGMIRPR